MEKVLGLWWSVLSKRQIDGDGLMGMCPRCEDQKLVSYTLDEMGIEDLSGAVLEVKGLGVERCRGCHGLLLDTTKAQGALNAAAELFSVKGADLVGITCSSCQTEAAPGETTCANCGDGLGLSCPCCSGSMALAKAFRVELDVCQKCDALWFDDGEIEKVHRRYRRRKGKETAPYGTAVPAQTDTSTPLPTVTCLKCNTEGFRIRDVYKTKEGYICRPCMGGKSESEGRGLSVGMMNEGGVVSGVVDAMVTLAVVDAIFDLFSD